MFLHLAGFDGPMDLLLHLIKVNAINIFNIPMIVITEQYLQFLRQAPDMDFVNAGEYLSMAAQLIEIKASSIVSTLQGKGAPQSLDEIDETDPRKPLVQQLLEFKAIQQACLELDKQLMLGRDVFASGETKRRQSELENLAPPVKGDAFSLIIALEEVLLRLSENKNLPKVTLQPQGLSIQARMIFVKDLYDQKSTWTLLDILLISESRYELIITFMAILELTKAGQLQLEQQELFGEVLISKSYKFNADLPLEDADISEDTAAYS